MKLTNAAVKKMSTKHCSKVLQEKTSFFSKNFIFSLFLVFSFQVNNHANAYFGVNSVCVKGCFA